MEWSGRASAYPPFPKVGSGVGQTEARWRCRPFPLPYLQSPSPLHSILPRIGCLDLHLSWYHAPTDNAIPTLAENPTHVPNPTEPIQSCQTSSFTLPSSTTAPLLLPFLCNLRFTKIYSRFLSVASCNMDPPISPNGTCLSLHLYPLPKPHSNQKF